jgi:broad specificity phosphatase PhoE
MTDGRRFILVRHGRTTYNATHTLNGDPSVAVTLDDEGVRQARALRDRLAGLPIDLGVHTRFGRTRQTLEIALAGRDVPEAECADLDDVALGEFEGATAEAYRAWRTSLPQDARPPGGGESRVDVLVRYVRGFERLVAARAALPLVVTHDIPIRFLQNAMRGADPLDGPVTAVGNAAEIIVGERDLRRAITVMNDRIPPGAR